VLLTDYTTFSFLHVLGMASGLAACSQAGDWTRRQVALNVALCKSLLRHITFSKTPLDKWSAHPRDLYLTTHSTQKRQTSMP